MHDRQESTVFWEMDVRRRYTGGDNAASVNRGQMTAALKKFYVQEALGIGARIQMVLSAAFRVPTPTRRGSCTTSTTIRRDQPSQSRRLAR